MLLVQFFIFEVIYYVFQLILILIYPNNIIELNIARYLWSWLGLFLTQSSKETSLLLIALVDPISNDQINYYVTFEFGHLYEIGDPLIDPLFFQKAIQEPNRPNSSNQFFKHPKL